jgi:hypothetical protein
VKALNNEYVHWISGFSTLAGIDSALVHNHTLYMLQVTIADKHDVNVVSFRRAFADRVMSNMVMFVVVPMVSQFKCQRRRDAHRRHKRTGKEADGHPMSRARGRREGCRRQAQNRRFDPPVGGCDAIMQEIGRQGHPR